MTSRDTSRRHHRSVVIITRKSLIGTSARNKIFYWLICVVHYFALKIFKYACATGYCFRICDLVRLCVCVCACVWCTCVRACARTYASACVIRVFLTKQLRPAMHTVHIMLCILYTSCYVYCTHPAMYTVHILLCILYTSCYIYCRLHILLVSLESCANFVFFLQANFAFLISYDTDIYFEIRHMQNSPIESLKSTFQHQFYVILDIIYIIFVA